MTSPWIRIRGESIEYMFAVTAVAKCQAFIRDLNIDRHEKEQALRKARAEQNKIISLEGGGDRLAQSIRRCGNLEKQLAEIKGKLVRANKKLSLCRKAKDDTLQSLEPHLESFWEAKYVKVLDAGDLAAIFLMGNLKSHKSIRFSIGSSARNITSINRIGRLMGIQGPLLELAGDRLYELKRDSDEIILVPEKDHRRYGFSVR